ncbi:MAG: TrmH family RNA methyltransferase [Myxococcota bacterium]|nr:TrmH family RNA methyltransferase [Myxococcota bacterium]
MTRKTRNELIQADIDQAIQYPVHLVAIHFNDDHNLAFLIRAAACFGAKSVMVIGSLPPYRILRQLSVGLCNYIPIQQFSTPKDFLLHAEKNTLEVFSIELCEGAQPITDFQFPNKELCIVTGHESVGVPTEILIRSTPLYIPMPGVGKCLNTSQAANVALFEYVRQKGGYNASRLEKL